MFKEEKSKKKIKTGKTKIVKTKTNSQCKNKGITLISLVITIVILLILAGVAISMAVDSNGLFARARQAADEWNESVAEEKSELGNVMNIINQKTLGEVYTDAMIGQKLTYTANEQSEWIVFGKDKKGNILITTEEPIEVDIQLEFESDAKAYFDYPDKLHEICSVYGGTVQNVTIDARSITLDDINYVTGFKEPEFDTYTFGTKLDFSNKQLDFYYPSLSAADTEYWKKPNVDGEITIINNWYAYGRSKEDGSLWLNCSKGQNLVPTVEHSERFDIVMGPTSQDWYYDVASCRDYIQKDPDYYFLNASQVNPYGIWADGMFGLGESNSTSYSNYKKYYVSGIRPIIELPEYLKVTEKNGIYDLI